MSHALATMRVDDKVTKIKTISDAKTPYLKKAKERNNQIGFLLVYFCLKCGIQLQYSNRTLILYNMFILIIHTVFTTCSNKQLGVKLQKLLINMLMCKIC